MAGRRYVRDRLGRFAAAGAGATARGGRLTRKSGSHYDTQTKEIAGDRPAGTVSRTRRSRPTAPAAAVRRDKLQSGPLASAGDSVKQGLRGMGNRAINRVETAARLSELQKAGKLDRLSPSQSRRAQSVFNDAQRKVSVAPRIAAEQRQIQLAIKADKMRREGAASKASVSGRPLRERRGIPGTVRPSRFESRSEGGRVTRQVMRDMPAVPKGRKPDDTWQGINSFNTSSSRPRTLSGRQATAMQQTLAQQGWTRRSDSLGRSVTYSKSFDGPGGTSEIGRVRVTGRGGPLASRQVEVSRMVSSRPGRRNSSGGLIEARYGLRRNKPASRTPRRK